MQAISWLYNTPVINFLLTSWNVDKREKNYKNLDILIRQRVFRWNKKHFPEFVKGFFDEI